MQAKILIGVNDAHGSWVQRCRDRRARAAPIWRTRPDRADVRCVSGRLCRRRLWPGRPGRRRAARGGAPPAPRGRAPARFRAALPPRARHSTDFPCRGRRSVAATGASVITAGASPGPSASPARRARCRPIRAAAAARGSPLRDGGGALSVRAAALDARGSVGNAAGRRQAARQIISEPVFAVYAPLPISVRPEQATLAWLRGRSS